MLRLRMLIHLYLRLSIVMPLTLLICNHGFLREIVAM